MKSPAFQVYVNDFLGSAKVGMMSTEEIGAYWLLLFLEWQEIGFVYNEQQLSRWCRLTPSRFKKAWVALKPCFVEIEGRLYNPRLQKEREKQEAWRDKSAKGGKKSGEARAKGGSRMVEPTPQPKTNTPLPLPLQVTTKAPKSGWVVRFLTAYIEATKGSYSAGRLGRELKDLIRDNGENPAFIAWTAFLASPDRKYGPPYFAKNYVDYAKRNGSDPAHEQFVKRGYLV